MNKTDGPGVPGGRWRKYKMAFNTKLTIRLEVKMLKCLNLSQECRPPLLFCFCFCFAPVCKQQPQLCREVWCSKSLFCPPTIPAGSCRRPTSLKFNALNQGQIHPWMGNGHHHCSFEAFSHVLDIPQFDNIFHQNHNQSDAACMVAVF